MWPEWQKIETAPKDGTQILILTENGTRLIAWWNGKAWSHGNGHFSNLALVKFFSPLPPPPSMAAETDENQTTPQQQGRTTSAARQDGRAGKTTSEEAKTEIPPSKQVAPPPVERGDIVSGLDFDAKLEWHGGMGAEVQIARDITDTPESPFYKQPLPPSSDVGELVGRLRNLAWEEHDGQVLILSAVQTQNDAEAAAAMLQAQAAEIDNERKARSLVRQWLWNALNRGEEMEDQIAALTEKLEELQEWFQENGPVL